MKKRIFKDFSPLGLSFLILIIPALIASASGLREEARDYRKEGYELQKVKDYPGALTMYQKAAELDPSWAAPHNDIGVLREKEGNLDQAIQSYKQALDLDPEYLPAHANLAMIYEHMNVPKKAINHWLTRYTLGKLDDPWVLYAKARLIALGALEGPPPDESASALQQRWDQGFKYYDKLLEEYYTVTEEHGDW